MTTMTKDIRTQLQRFVRDMRTHFAKQFDMVEVHSYDDGVRTIKHANGSTESVTHATITVALSRKKEQAP